MVQPVDYSLNVQSPLQAFGQAAQFGAGIAEMGARRQAAQQDAVRQENLNQEVQRVNAIQNPTADDYRKLSFLLPKAQMDSVRATFELGSKEQQANQLAFSGKVLAAFTSGNNQVAIDLLNNRADAEENSGRKELAKGFRDSAVLAKTNPLLAKNTIAVNMAVIPGGKEVFEAALKLVPAQPKAGFTLLTPAQNIELGLDPDVRFQRGPNGQLEELKISAKPKPDFRFLTPQEKEERGIKDEGSYQIGPDGKVSPVKTGPLVTIDSGDKRDVLALKELDIPRAKEFSAAAASARAVARDSRVIADLLKGKSGGSVIKLTAEVAKNLGLSTETVTANDLANSLATRGAVQIRPPGSGSTSDTEFKSFIAAFPSLSNSEAGRELMAKYAEAFAKRSARLADHSRKLIREDKYSEEEIARFDESLGTLLDKDFYNFVSGKRSGVQQFPGTAPATAPTRPAAPAAAPATRPASGVKFLGFE